MKIRICSFVFFFILIISCKSEYDQYVKRELKKGIENKELIFDLELGITRKQFYDICWQLNKDKIVSQGPKNQFVKYIIEEGSITGETDKIEMLFYGIFDEELIMRGLDFQFSYPKWAVWNENYHSTVLIKSVQQYFLDTFPGNEFIKISLGKEDLFSYVKIDGNRQILIYPKDTKDVVVKVEDLKHKLSSKFSSQ